MMILQGQGKVFSQIAEETEQTFYNWLQYSCITEDEFLRRINQDNFKIIYHEEGKNTVWIDFFEGIVKVGESIIVNFENSIEQQEGIMDIILLLQLIKVKVEERKGNPKTVEKLSECSLKLNVMFL